jgi:uncharacterized protein
MSKILISGGSGALGRALTRELTDHGHTVHWLGRTVSTTKGTICFAWDPATGYIDHKAFEGVDHVVHLAGSNIGEKAWTPKYKQEILDSRVKSSNLLIRTILQNQYPIRSFIGASATGYYGIHRGSEACSENDSVGHDFLAQVCKEWEQSYNSISEAGIRTCIVRIGIVLGKDFGMYGKLAPLFRLGLGARIGKTSEYISWIHCSDLVRLFRFCIENTQVEGVLNAVSSEPEQSGNFMTQLASSFKRKIILPTIPEFFIRVFMGERSSLVCNGVKVNNQKIKSYGFVFYFDALKKALEDLINQ